MKGSDIVAKLGGVETVDDATSLIAQKTDAEQLARFEKIRSDEVRIKIANAVAMCEPESVWFNTGSEADKAYCRALAIEQGQEKPLAMKNHTIHFDLPQEQGRIVDRTYYIINEGEAVSSLGKKMLRGEAIEDIGAKMGGICKGRQLLVGFFLRGPAGAPVSNPALEISSSPYVMHSANILYRPAYDVFDDAVEKAGYFYTNIHSEGENRPEDLPNARVFMDRSWWTTYSMFCTYAGNTLLLKKGNHRFTVDKSVYLGEARELSEHMFITGMKGPGGRVTWFCGAAPSGCGKTTTAMAGDNFVGDDLAQIWIAGDGSVRAVNPEAGIFGIVADVNEEGDPILMKLLRREGTEVIWSNVLVDDAGVPHWTGNGERHPDKGFNFQGDWFKGKTDANGRPIPISHPNARCTLAASALGNYDPSSESAEGVNARVFTYSGRDADTMPPVWVARDSKEGVAIGACIVSQATATEVGASGVKRAPWANAPFIPGALGDYMRAQLDFFGNPAIAPGSKPVMAGLNYFLTHRARGGESTRLLGEKRDVKVWLSWLDRLAHGEVGTIETPIGLIPRYEDLAALFAAIIGKDYGEDLYTQQFSIYVDNIVARLDLQIAAYGAETPAVPGELFEVLEEQKADLLALKAKHGPVVTPDQL